MIVYQDMLIGSSAQIICPNQHCNLYQTCDYSSACIPNGRYRASESHFSPTPWGSGSELTSYADAHGNMIQQLRPPATRRGEAFPLKILALVFRSHTCQNLYNIKPVLLHSIMLPMRWVISIHNIHSGVE